MWTRARANLLGALVSAGAILGFVGIPTLLFGPVGGVVGLALGWCVVLAAGSMRRRRAAEAAAGSTSGV